MSASKRFIKWGIEKLGCLYTLGSEAKRGGSLWVEKMRCWEIGKWRRMQQYSNGD